MGHRSLFGEISISELTATQVKLLTITHLYDVIRSGPGADGEIPDNVLPYPLSMQEWYNNYKLQQKLEREKQQQKDPSLRHKSQKKKPAYADETDLQALSIWSMNRKVGED